MTQKVLGKICSAEYGKYKALDEFFGLQLDFSLGDGTKANSTIKYTVNISPYRSWTSTERATAITKQIDFINQLLNDAKCSYISELINKPVEVEIDEDKKLFFNFRILTEVL